MDETSSQHNRFSALLASINSQVICNVVDNSLMTLVIIAETKKICLYGVKNPIQYQRPEMKAVYGNRG